MNNSNVIVREAKLASIPEEKQEVQGQETAAEDFKDTLKREEEKQDEDKIPRESVRLRIFNLLNKATIGYTRQEVMKKLGITDTQNVFRDEGLRDKPRIRRIEVVGVRGMVYALTARGKRAIENGTVDTDKPPSSMKSDKKQWKDGLLANSGRPRGTGKRKII